MPDKWTQDDVVFAVLRGMHVASPRSVADDLMAAADQSGRLDGVSPLRARVRAAEVLLRAGDRAESLGVIRQALRERGPDPDGKATLAAAAALAELGEGDEAESLVLQVMRDHQNDAGLAARFVALSLVFGASGLYEQGQRVADACAASVAQAGRRMSAVGPRVTTLASMAKREIAAMQQRSAEDGADPAAQLAARQRRKQEAAEQAAAAALSQPPWPAMAGQFMLWFPEDQYGRLTRQLPDLAGVLGASWREHTARVESTLAEQMAAASAKGAEQQPKLAAGDSWTYADFAEHCGADPRLAPVLTAYTERAARGLGTPVSWPPGKRDKCWCGSGQRYQRCCGAGRSG
ncbi:MAG TPA: SEC-C domain-containing protein [Streptosporangiaceae bacterium]